MNGICRWCYELTASPSTRWHLYCLDAYRVASGQHPDEIQYTLCEICGDPSDEMDHRLVDRSSQGARPSGDAACVHSGQPAMVVPELPQAQDAAGPAAGEVPVGVFTGLVFRKASAQAESQMGAVVPDAVQPRAFATAVWRELMP